MKCIEGIGITFPGMFGISTEPYKAVLGHENEGLRLQNAYFRIDNVLITID